MSTTLTKARPTGAREAAEPSVAIPPAVLYPARKRLAEKRAEFEKACSDISEYRAKSARAERDEQEALDNAKLSESEAAEAISRAQNLKSVFLSRTANKEKAIAALATELKSAVGQATLELRGLANQEISRRVAIISERVLTALGAESVERIGRKPALVALLEYSFPIETVRRLQPQNFVSLDDNEHLIAASKDLLGKFERVISETQKHL